MVCGRHGGTEERLTWGGLVAFPMKVFMPQVGPKSRRGRSGYKAMPKCSVDAQREVRGLIVAATRRESGATGVKPALDVRARERGRAWCEGGPQEWERESDALLSTALEAREVPVGKTPVQAREDQQRGASRSSPNGKRRKFHSLMGQVLDLRRLRRRV